MNRIMKKIINVFYLFLSTMVLFIHKQIRYVSRI